MWVGPNRHERTQVLSGGDLEIVAGFTDDAAMQKLGVRALVVVQPGTHSCDSPGNPLAYHVVTLGDALSTDGPLSTCAELTVSATPGAIVLEGDPLADGGYYAWTWGPARGSPAGRTDVAQPRGLGASA